MKPVILDETEHDVDQPEERQIPRQQAFELAGEHAHGERNGDREEQLARFRGVVLPRVPDSVPHPDAEQDAARDEQSAREVIANSHDALGEKQRRARRHEHDRPRLEEPERPRRHAEKHPRADQQDGQEDEHGGGHGAACG